MKKAPLLLTLGALSLAVLSAFLIAANPAPPRAAPQAAKSPLGPGQTAGKIPVLLVKGMWSQHWKLDDALASPPNLYAVSSSYVTQRYNYVFALKYFPDKEADLLSRKVVILANVPTTAILRQGPRNDMKPVDGRSDQWLVDFVEHGGGLLVLGGSFSFDLETTTRDPGKSPLRNTFKDSALAKILPAELGDKPMTFESQNKPLELVPNGRHPVLADLDFSDHPITLFYHPMKPKKDATVLITAGDAPILILGNYGKGRVAIFLATLHGDPAKNLTPYWQSKSWAPLLRNTTRWLAGP